MNGGSKSGGEGGEGGGGQRSFERIWDRECQEF